MHSDKSMASYFLHIDEVVNCMMNVGEEIKEVTLVEKVLRSLSTKFESKVCAIEEKQDLQTITMTQLHGILTSIEIRKGGPSDMREAEFKASEKGRKKHNESGHISKEEDEVNFVKKFQWVPEDLEVSYPSNALHVVESTIMLPNVLIKINMKKGRNMQNGI